MADKQIDPRKLCLMKLDVDESDDCIRKKCEKFGPIKHFQRPANKELAFVLYGDENIAKAAKDGLLKMGINVNFARAKKVDGNNNFDGERTERASVQQRIVAKLTSPDPECGTPVEPISPPDSTVAVIKEPIGKSNGFVRPATSIQNIDRYFGTCVYCNHDAGLTCQRCGDFYCSEECQDADWLAHKRVCFPMPKLTAPKPFINGLRRIMNVPTDVTVSAENLSIMKRNSLTSDSIDGIKKLPPMNQDVEKQSPIVESALVKPAPQVVKSPEVANPMSDKVKTSIVSTPEVKTPNTVVLAKENSVESGSVKESKAPRGRGKFLEEIIDDSKPKTNTRPTIDQIEVTTIKNGDVVEVTATANHHSLYIRSMAFNDEYLKLNIAVTQAADKAPQIIGIPERNEIVLAPFEDAYYRALILSDNRDLDKMSVAFIDFGNTDWVSRKSLKKLPEDLLKYRRQPIRVFLKDVVSDVDDDESEKMKNYLKTLEYSEFKVKSKNPIVATKSVVELIDIKTDKLVNKAVAKLAKERYFETNIKKKELDAIGETVLITENRRLAKEAIVTCVLQSDGSKFSSQHDEIQAYGESVKNDAAYSPRHLELCVVKILEEDEPIWYRAQYQQQLVDGRAQVALIDYGITDNVLENDIRVFNKKLVFECLALTCSVKKGVIPKAEMINKLVTFARAKTVSIKPVEGTTIHAVDFEWGSIH